MRIGHAVAAILLVALSVAGCKPKPGAKCKTDGKEVCNEATNALVCRDGVWKEMACRGKDGCKQQGGEVACDQSVAQASDLCNDESKAVCTTDTKAALECKTGKWVLKDRCLGPKACTTDNLFVHCDNSVGNAGDPCGQADDHACTVDGKSILVCKDDKWELGSTCRGKDGCKANGDTVTCDQSLANVGDACEGSTPACSTDLKTLLECKGGKMALDQTCKKGCEVTVTGEHTGTVGCK